MSRFRRGGKKSQSDRPASVHRKLSSGRLSHWYSHRPVLTVDQLHAYRRKDFGVAAADPTAEARRPPISLSASPSFDTEYRCQYEPPYPTAEEMSVNRRHAAVPRDQLRVEGDAEFTVEYADQFKDAPRERNLAPRQGSHIGPFVCADEPAPEGLAARSEQHDRFVPHPDGKRSDRLRPSTGLRVEGAPMDGETEQMASYRQLPDPADPEDTSAPDAAKDRHSKIESVPEMCRPTAWMRPFDEAMAEMVLTRDSGMLLRPARSFAHDGAGTWTERRGSVKKPAFRLEVVDCSSGGGDGPGGDGRTVAFVVLERTSSPARTLSVVDDQDEDDDKDDEDDDDRNSRGIGSVRAGSASGGNRWVKRRQRRMGTARFFDETRDVRRPSTSRGKTIQ